MKTAKQLRPKCKWCAKPCRPVYELICQDCGHAAYWHLYNKQTSCQDGKCPCRNIHYAFNDSDTANPDRFKKTLQGFGLQAKSLFCTQDCAVRWALKYAAIAVPLGRS
jgi:hypothetical protein